MSQEEAQAQQDVAVSSKKRKPMSEARLLKRKQRAEQLKEKIKVSAPAPEGLTKTWERENRAKLIRAQKAKAKAEGLEKKRQEQARRIEAYELEYRQIKEKRDELITAARKEGNIYKPDDPKIAIVIRIRGINRVSPKVRRVLQLFRLLQIHNAVFIKVNKATINMLKLIQPYIAYGYPTVDTIRSLVYKRGFAKIRHRPGAISRVPIMSNDLIEQYLGRRGIETIEDMVYQIYTCGDNFRACSNFLWPFKLNNPRGGYRGRKRRHYNEGGSYGNWESHIDTLVARML